MLFFVVIGSWPHGSTWAVINKCSWNILNVLKSQKTVYVCKNYDTSNFSISSTFRIRLDDFPNPKKSHTKQSQEIFGVEKL